MPKRFKRIFCDRFATMPVGGMFVGTRRQCNTESQTSLTGLVQPQYQVREKLPTNCSDQIGTLDSITVYPKLIQF